MRACACMCVFALLCVRVHVCACECVCVRACGMRNVFEAASFRCVYGRDREWRGGGGVTPATRHFFGGDLIIAECTPLRQVHDGKL